MTGMKNIPAAENFINTFLKESGLPVDNYIISPLAGDGSKRLFQRLKPESSIITFIFMQNPPGDEFNKKENYAYSPYPETTCCPRVCLFPPDN
jgi:hypothetical protein